MPDLQKYWDSVARKEKELEPLGDLLWITSLDRSDRGLSGGHITDVSRRLAAQCIAEGTHRLATEQEKQQEQQRRAEQLETYRRREQERKPPPVIVVAKSQEEMSLTPPPPANPESARVRRTA